MSWYSTIERYWCTKERYSKISVHVIFSRFLKRHEAYLLLFFLFFSADLFAQSAPAIKSSLNRDHVLIGEPVEILVEVKTPPDQPVSVWYNLPDSFNHLEVLSRSAIDSANRTDLHIYQQRITVTGFDSGIWTIPPLKIIVNKKAILSDALSVTIIPVQLQDSTYHGVREIIDVPGVKTNWGYWVAGLLSAVLLLILIKAWLKTRTKNIISEHSTSGLSPLQEAMGDFQKLSTMGLEVKGEWNLYYSTLTDIFRRYIERKFQIPAGKKTTDELLLFLIRKQDKETNSLIAQTLRIADAVKFAKYQPGEKQAVESLRTIENAVQVLDHIKL